jgi:hypothetical protein
MFQFLPGESFIDYWGPIGLDHVLMSCTECPQIAFRVLHLKSQFVEREVALCGAHYTEACARYPEVRRASAGQRAG